MPPQARVPPVELTVMRPRIGEGIVRVLVRFLGRAPESEEVQRELFRYRVRRDDAARAAAESSLRDLAQKRYGGAAPYPLAARARHQLDLKVARVVRRSVGPDRVKLDAVAAAHSLAPEVVAEFLERLNRGQPWRLRMAPPGADCKIRRATETPNAIAPHYPTGAYDAVMRSRLGGTNDNVDGGAP
jgi:hypothetical protein